MIAKRLMQHIALLYLVVIVLIACRSAVLPIDPAASNSSLELRTPTTYIQVKACAESDIPNRPSPNYGLPGSLVYSYMGKFYLVGGNPIANRPLPIAEQTEGAASMIGFSPDGKWFAYFTGSAYEGRSYKLHLISTESDEVITVPEYEIVPIRRGDYTGASSFRWLTNQYMLAEISDPRENYRDRLVHAVINPFNGQWIESALEDLPDRATARHHEGAVVFDPSFGRVLYAARIKNDIDSSVVAPVLWDFKREAELWRGPDLSYSDFAYGIRDRASWSPDGSQVAFVGPENPDLPAKLHLDQQGVYILDRNDSSLQLVTDFLATQNAFSAGGLSWSPDGRYLAFQLLQRTAADEEAKYGIYLYDLETDQVIFLCSRKQTVYYDMDAPIWSPNGHYLAYTSTDYPFEGSQVVRSLNVINIYTGEVVIVAEPIGQLGGWSSFWP